MTAPIRARPWVRAVGRWAGAHRVAIAYGTLVIAIAVRNIWNLGGVPPGLYVDESSIGYNAYAIAHFGRDEHGVAFPLYPEAFGEYKNPVYIYTLALLSRFAGLSVFLTRLPAALFGLIACVAVAATVLRVTRSHAAAWLTLLLAGLTPWLTLESRVGFEVISMVAVMAIMLWCLAEAGWRDEAVRRTAGAARERGRSAGHQLLDRQKIAPRFPVRWYVAAGCAAAVAIYAYSTARLEVALFAGALVVSFVLPWRRRWWMTLLPILAGYAALGLWMLAHPGALTSRFDLISITVDHATGRPKPFHDIWYLFWSNYWQYISPDFLFVHGDSNPRHNTQWGGMLLVPMAILLVAGILWTLRHSKRPLPRFLLLLLPLGPVAAALTDQATPHSLRAADMLPGLLVIAGCGIAALVAVVTAILSYISADEDSRDLARELTFFVVAAALLRWGLLYQLDLFTMYPDRAAAAFDTGELDAISAARQLAGAHHTVYLVDDGNLDVPYIQAAFLYPAEIRPPAHATEDQATDLLGQIGMSVVHDPAALAQSMHRGDVAVIGSGEPAPPGMTVVYASGVAADYSPGS